MLYPKNCNHFPSVIGSYQKEQFFNSMKYVKTNHTAIDVGAHCGHWTFNMCNFFNKVDSYEPIKENFDCLEHNVGSNLKTNLYNFGLSNYDGIAYLNNPAPHNSGAWEKSDHGTEISVYRLDTLYNSRNDVISYIKLDCQGYEYEVITGGENLIKKHKPVICCEVVCHGVTDTRVIELLKSYGYNLISQVGKDAVFITKDKE